MVESLSRIGETNNIAIHGDISYSVNISIYYINRTLKTLIFGVMSACFAYKSTIIIRIRQSTIRQQSGVNFWYAQKGWRKSNFSENMSSC